ncbi:MAG: DUF885 domain-containing protein [bacterium]
MQEKRKRGRPPGIVKGFPKPRRRKLTAADKMFRRICREYEHNVYKFFPTYGTYMGLPEYDAKLSKPSLQWFLRWERVLSNTLEELKMVNADDLSADNRVDLEIGKNQIELELEELRDRPHWRRSPSMYFSEPMYGIYSVLTRGGKDLLSRANGIIARTEKLPKQLLFGMRNLDNPPRIFTESAILSAQGARVFFDTTVREFAGKLASSKAKRLRDACDAAVRSLDNYIEWMKTDLLPRSNGEWKAGARRFNNKLKKYHEVPFDADELYKLGQKIYKNTLNQLAATAKQIDKRRDWTKIVATLKDEHPSNAGLVDYYAKEMARARRFVIEKDLVSFPPKEQIKVVETPDFARPLIPYAAYLTPGMYEADQTGIFWVTTVAKGTPKDRAEEQLKGHSKYGIVVTALHEAYPGHHLQLTRANQKRRIFRHMHHTSVFAEGWALYCEEMMYEQGFYTDPRVRLFQLKDQLWRACRVMIDVALHTRDMTYEQAVNFLVEKAHLERPNAEAEVRRYCQTPTQPMSYVIGKHLMLELRDRLRERWGSKFTLKLFHDHVIDHGTIPISRVEELIIAYTTRT